MSTEIHTYKIIGPRGEGPYEASGPSAIAAINSSPLRGQYSLEEPRGPHGAVVGYEPCGNALSKVGAFDITWLRRSAE